MKSDEGKQARKAVQMIFSRKPNTFSLYLKGIIAKRRGLMPGEKIQEMKVEWKDFRIDPSHLNKVSALCGLHQSGTMPLIYPLTFLFPLHMIMIAHEKFPLLYLRMLHIRDHIRQNRPVGTGEVLHISCKIQGQRVMPKGLEFDIHSLVSSEDEPVWEGISTNFFPWSFGEPGQPSLLAGFDPLPDECDTVQWTMPRGSGLRFGLLIGDYNGIHYLAPYARMLGFKRDFSHAQRSMAECLRRLPSLNGNEPLCLDVSLKGPVYYSERVTLKYAGRNGGYRFDLLASGDDRPRIMGNIFQAETGQLQNRM